MSSTTPNSPVRRQGARARPSNPAHAEGGGAGGPQLVSAIARGFEVLRAFTPQDSMLGNQELAQRVGQPKATVSRITYTLTRLGYLTYLPQFAKYQLGVGVLALGQAVTSSSIWRLARPLMQELALEMDASVALAEQDGLELLYVGRCLPNSPVALQLDAGSRLPLATSAAGRAVFAALPAGEQARILAELEMLPQTDWARLRDGLKEAVAMYGRVGFTASLGDWRPEVHAVGAALLLPNGAGILGLNCGAPAYGLDRARAMLEAGPKLLALSHRLSELLRPPG